MQYSNSDATAASNGMIIVMTEPMDIDPDARASEDVSMDISINDANTTINESTMEKLWAKEQYEMSQGDRQAACYELHGVKSRYDASEYENPGYHYGALIKFDEELNNKKSGITDHVKRNYHRALAMNSMYVTSSDFRLRFLRAEFFDVHKAVVRFCNCLNLLVEIYGDISLVRQLFLSDLTKSERKLLKEGGMQLSPSRDSLGRRTIFFLGNVGANFTHEERDRVGLYLLFQVLAEDVTTQRNGLVTIHLMSDDVMRTMGGDNTTRMSSLFGSIFEASPLRFSAVHFCFPNDIIYRLLKPVMLFVIGNAFRRVLKIHSGTTIECNYSLSSFGVRLDDIPITYSGTVKTRQHKKWLKARAAMDKFIVQQAKENVDGDYSSFYASDAYSIQPFPHIQCPEINCVLFHKNGVAWDFPGNIKFRAFLHDELSDKTVYTNNKTTNSEGDSASASEDVFDRIIRLSRLQNFQFLLHDETNHWYIEISETEMLRKYVGFGIRGHQRRCNAQRNRQNQCSNWSMNRGSESNTAINRRNNSVVRVNETDRTNNIVGMDFSANMAERATQNNLFAQNVEGEAPLCSFESCGCFKSV